MQSSYYRVLVRKDNHVVEAGPSPRSRMAAVKFGEAIAAQEPDAEVYVEIVTMRVERFKTFKARAALQTEVRGDG